MAEAKRVKLKGDMPHAAHTAEITADGGLVVELYDFSDDAHSSLGNDVAFLLRLSSEAKGELLSKLIETGGPLESAGGQEDDLVLRLLSERFATYHDVQKWLQEHAIPFQKEFDSWA
jgi:hypothetical protein